MTLMGVIGTFVGVSASIPVAFITGVTVAGIRPNHVGTCSIGRAAVDSFAFVDISTPSPVTTEPFVASTFV